MRSCYPQPDWSRRGLGPMAWKIDVETTTSAGHRIHLDPPACGLHQEAADGEAKPASLSARFRDERSEDVADSLMPDAAATVGDRDLKSAAISRCGDDRFASPAHCRLGVKQEIQQNVLERGLAN